MRILMVSIFGPHFFNWTNLLENSHHEVYWIDVFDSNTKVEKIKFVRQYVGWKNRLDYPGRYLVKKYLPGFYNAVNKLNQRNLAEFVDEKIKEIKPDVVQSFVLQTGALPILEVMKKYPKIKWIFSAWGNDLFFRQQNKKDLLDIRKTLPEFDYMFADCKRDHQVALDHGFTGKFLGAFPGGGGYELSKYESKIKPFSNRNLILIKGYEGKLGRCNIILEAILNLKFLLKEFEIVVFSANEKVRKYIEVTGLENWENFSCYGLIPHSEVMSLMGKAKIYIGNSISDGMPNTLLEAIVMGAYPIQSNPGNVTEELISHDHGGLLIQDPMNAKEIEELIKKAFSKPFQLKSQIKYNFQDVRPRLERSKIRQEVLSRYQLIENEIK